MHKAEAVLENHTHKVLWAFEIQTNQLIIVRKPNPVIINKNKLTCRKVDQLGKSKKTERETTLTLQELKKKTEIREVTMIPIVIGALRMVHKRLDYELEELEIGERIQTMLRILRRVVETWRDLLSFGLEWKTIN